MRFIKYVEIDEEIAVFKITRDNLSVDVFPWSDSDMADLNNFIDQLTKKKYDLMLAQKMASKLLPPIDKSHEHIVISPDKIFSKLPFEVLSIDNQLIIEKYKISYTSHLGFINSKIPMVPHEQDIAIYAPQYLEKGDQNVRTGETVALKGALRESQSIGELFDSKLFTGPTLSKQNFIETASNHKILHLALHAKLDDHESGISRLLFSDENSEDDDLFLEELYGLNLNADMAVLSACNTGIESSNTTSDIKSFQRAFTFSGVPATVASLWEVPDLSTEKIMISFYKNLKKGQSKSEALKNAKINFLNKHKGTKLEQPYYWAGFVLYGDDTLVVESSINWILRF
jgi:CHAT domain-containing protein